MNYTVGHTYYFLDVVYPQVAAIRGWSIQKILVTPQLLHFIFTPDYNFPFLNTRVRLQPPPLTPPPPHHLTIHSDQYSLPFLLYICLCICLHEAIYICVYAYV
ncbi:hypothetical protein EON65_00925 [archaeon]|nr:MAG: hypothetical protein EON65_00925 [archaeon]